MAYYSRLNIQLGIIPTLPEEYGELQGTFQEVYNALHMLNSALDGAVGVLSAPNPGTSPANSISFQMRSFFAPVAENVDEAGKIVHLPSGASEFVLGATGYVTAPTDGKKVTGPWAMTLGTRTESGEILLGMPPAAMELSGATNVGEIVYTKGTGDLYAGATGSEYWPVGQVIKEGVVLLLPSMYADVQS